MSDIYARLRGNSYPGRGIILGKSPGGKAVAAYFIMGRSENSRNRVFAEDGEGIRTEAHDPAKMSDPSLVIYSPVKVLGDCTIVTNGDQTDTIYDFLNAGGSFEDALQTRVFEPDAPNFTPRISGILKNGGGYKLAILKSAGRGSCQRFFYEYDSPLAGQGHFIHTYENDGNPLPAFTGEPRLIKTEDSIDEFTAKLWNALDPQNKISLFTRYIDLDTGEYDSIILNKN